MDGKRKRWLSETKHKTRIHQKPGGWLFSQKQIYFGPWLTKEKSKVVWQGDSPEEFTVCWLTSYSTISGQHCASVSLEKPVDFQSFTIVGHSILGGVVLLPVDFNYHCPWPRKGTGQGTNRGPPSWNEQLLLPKIGLPNRKRIFQPQCLTMRKGGKQADVRSHSIHVWYIYLHLP